MSYLYIRGFSKPKMLETLTAQFNLNNDEKSYDDDGSNHNKKNNLVNSHITERLNRAAAILVTSAKEV